ncbi:class I adenylate-forming enzyme family protein [Parvularcula maris]|uniref:AMP-binding protein n=1 Tax=Parvularcula maris TaxID=2965077 RepID=A0A9X2LB61_9PROT|nr:AMP-binding protein [Parvularcula maris]MCQ8186470.1 AMP-binding protein [Parvularcula maris]
METTTSGGWPQMSLDEVRARLCGPGATFETETADIRGIPTRVWKNGPKTLPDLLRHAAGHGEATFLVLDGERVSFAAFAAASAHLAEALAGRGIGRGDRVALAMRNLPEFPVAFFAIVSLGAIVVPLNAWWTRGELLFGLKDSGAKLLLCDAERWDVLERGAGVDTLVCRAGGTVPEGSALEALIGPPSSWAALPPKPLPDVAIEPDDHATIFYTSGTTGKPKGALGTHRSSVTNVMSSAYAAAAKHMRRGEEPPEPTPKSTLLTIPLFHVTACNARMMISLYAGYKIVLTRKWDPTEAFRLIERERITHAGGVPAIAWSLIEHPERKNHDLSSLEAIAYGGAPAAPELVRKIKEMTGCEPGSGWGMTETSGTVTIHGAEDYLHRPESCGPPVPVAELRIMSLDGEREMPVGEDGELWVKGPMVVEGYWNDADATAETFKEGWLKTGDVARLDEEGFCTIVDRAKDVIIRGGENIYSIEVENCLYEHPGVVEACVVPLPHRTLGEEPAAAVFLAEGQHTTEAELRAWTAERLAAFKVPVAIRTRKAPLPRNANGKVLKPVVRAELAQELGRGEGAG